MALNWVNDSYVTPFNERQGTSVYQTKQLTNLTPDYAFGRDLLQFIKTLLVPALVVVNKAPIELRYVSWFPYSVSASAYVWPKAMQFSSGGLTLSMTLSIWPYL